MHSTVIEPKAQNIRNEFDSLGEVPSDHLTFMQMQNESHLQLLGSGVLRTY